MAQNLTATRNKIVQRIERLLKLKVLNDDHLMHLHYIFSREENVKILPDRTRRLFRLDRYSEATIVQVVNFLDVVEQQQQQQQQQQQKPKATSEKSQQVVKLPDNIGSAVIGKKTKRMLKRHPPQDRETLPVVLPSSTSSKSANGESIEANSTLSEWLVEQTKRGKQARKVDPDMCCPSLLSAMTTDVRQLPAKKKRKKTAKKRNSKAPSKVESESEAPEEEPSAEIDVEADEDEEKDADVVLYDEGEAQAPIEDEELVGDEDAGEVGEEEGDDEEDEVGDEDEEDEDDGGDEDEEQQQSQQSAHSAANSDDDEDSD